MNPSPAAVAWIAARSPDWAQSDARIADALNAATVANPVGSAPKVPNTCYPSDILPLVGPASRAKINASTGFPRLYDDMNAGNSGGVGRWAAFYAGLDPAVITADEYAAIVGHLSGTHDDPSWTATLPAPVVALGRLLDSQDVAAARAAGGH